VPLAASHHSNERGWGHHGRRVSFQCLLRSRSLIWPSCRRCARGWQNHARLRLGVVMAADRDHFRMADCRPGHMVDRHRPLRVGEKIRRRSTEVARVAFRQPISVGRGLVHVGITTLTVTGPTRHRPGWCAARPSGGRASADHVGFTSASTSGLVLRTLRRLQVGSSHAVVVGTKGDTPYLPVRSEQRFRSHDGRSPHIGGGQDPRRNLSSVTAEN